MYALPTFKLYDHRNEADKTRYAKDSQIYNVLSTTVYFNIFGIYYNPDYQVSPVTSFYIWKEEEKKEASHKVIWNTGA